MKKGDPLIFSCVFKTKQEEVAARRELLDDTPARVRRRLPASPNGCSQLLVEEIHHLRQGLPPLVWVNSLSRFETRPGI